MTCGRRRQPIQPDRLAGDVDQPVLLLDIEMMMVAGAGIVLRTPALRRDLADQSGGAELPERVVDRRQRQGLAADHDIAEEILGGDMPVPIREEHTPEREALARRPQAGTLQDRAHLAERSQSRRPGRDHRLHDVHSFSLRSDHSLRIKCNWFALAIKFDRLR